MSQFFTNRPPEQKHRRNHPVMRSGHKYGIEFAGLCLSDRVYCAPTHYAGRSVGCLAALGKECEHCEKGWTPRWFGYIAIIHGKTKEIGLLELTAAAATEAAEFAEREGSLRGYVIIVSRLNGKKNGELKIRFERAKQILSEIPPSFCVTEALARMWRIKPELLVQKMGVEPTVEEMEKRGQLDEGDFKRHTTNGAA